MLEFLFPPLCQILLNYVRTNERKTFRRALVAPYVCWMKGWLNLTVCWPCLISCFLANIGRFPLESKQKSRKTFLYHYFTVTKHGASLPKVKVSRTMRSFIGTNNQNSIFSLKQSPRHCKQHKPRSNDKMLWRKWWSIMWKSSWGNFNPFTANNNVSCKRRPAQESY